MIKGCWGIVVLLSTAIFAAKSPAADSLRVEIDVIEAHCGPNGQSIAVCEELMSALWVNTSPFMAATDAEAFNVDAFNQKAAKRYVGAVLMPVDGATEYDLGVLGGTLEIALEASEIQNDQVTLGIEWRLTTPDDRMHEGSTEMRSTIGGDASIYSSGYRKTTAPNGGPTEATVRVMLLRVLEAI